MAHGPAGTSGSGAWQFAGTSGSAGEEGHRGAGVQAPMYRTMPERLGLATELTGRGSRSGEACLDSLFKKSLACLSSKSPLAGHAAAPISCGRRRARGLENHKRGVQSYTATQPRRLRCAKSLRRRESRTQESAQASYYYSRAYSRGLTIMIEEQAETFKKGEGGKVENQ